MADLIHWIDQKFYPSYGGHWDDTLLRNAILRHLRPDMRLLDLGAGAGILPQMNFRGLAREVIGIDLDPRVMSNPYLDRAIIADCESLPLGNGEADMVVADNVLEHLTRPEVVFREVHRVLRPGGIFVAKTPNKWHYMPCIARVTPLGFHRWFNRLRGRASEDTFPTVYRANCTSDLRRLAKSAGLELVKAELVEGRPEYLRFSGATYLAGLIYERVVNAVEIASPLRILLVVHIRKPES